MVRFDPLTNDDRKDCQLLQAKGKYQWRVHRLKLPISV